MRHHCSISGSRERKMNKGILVCFITFILTLISQCSGFYVINNSERKFERKKRFLTDSGFKKVKKYLQRRYAIAPQNGTSDDKHSYYTNSWAVHVYPPVKEVADRIAEKHGFVNIGQVSHVWKRLPLMRILINADLKIYENRHWLLFAKLHLNVNWSIDEKGLLSFLLSSASKGFLWVFYTFLKFSVTFHFRVRYSTNFEGCFYHFLVLNLRGRLNVS